MEDSQSAQATIRPPELFLLLDELKMKLARMLHPPKLTPWGTGGGKALGFASLLRNTDTQVAAWAVKLAPSLAQQLAQISELFRSLIEGSFFCFFFFWR